jgi:glycosyltransferase involved in cell wall biosynthesis
LLHTITVDSDSDSSRETRASVPITVVIPAYNAARLIGRTLAMLDLQTVRPAEIIVVDDGSTDDTADIAERTSARVIRAQHRCQAAARNIGIEAASHEWIAFLDADDIWDPQKLEYQWQVCQANPHLGLVSTDYDFIDTEGGVLRGDAVISLRQYRYITTEQLEQRASLLNGDLLGRSLPECGLFLPSAVMVSRELLRNVGGFDETVLAEDSEFFLRCIASAKAAMIERPLVGYVQHDSQHTATLAKQSALLNLCQHVLAHPERYHPESVARFPTLLPALLLRFAHWKASRGDYREAFLHACRALAAGFSVSVATSIVLRCAAKSRHARPLLEAIPGGRLFTALAPGRRPMPKQRASVPAWSSIIARTSGRQLVGD